MTPDHWDETRIGRLLAATRAEPDAGVLTRARARIAARAELPGGLAWLGSPAALVTACALLVASAGISFALLNDDAAGSRDTTLVSALIGDDGSYGLPASSGTAADSGPVDSGTVTP